MSDLTTKQCDVCGALKKEANHWWQMELSIPPVLDRTYTVRPMGESKLQDGVLDLCGEKCLDTAESRVRQGLDPRQPPAPQG